MLKKFLGPLIFFSYPSFSDTCLYPADPLNWVAQYCSIVESTDDEIVIQASKCFQSASGDLSKKSDSCKIKEKYKTKICKEKLKVDKKVKTIEECLKDPKVLPFFAGS